MSLSNSAVYFTPFRGGLIRDFTLQPALPFYERLLAVLKECKVTRYRLIKEKIIPQTSFIDWSRGGDPYMQSIIDLADYLDITLDYLVGRDR